MSVVASLTDEEREWVRSLREAASEEDRDSAYCRHAFNLVRWVRAWGSVDAARQTFLRHLNFRRTAVAHWERDAAVVFDGDYLLDEEEDEDDEFEELSQDDDEEPAPLTILGRSTAKTDGTSRILLFELTGLTDVPALVDNVAITPFMRRKFGVMERLHRRVVADERRTGKMSGGLLVMDLAGLSFSPSLISVLAGPYRVMWGTLLEMYPQLLSRIIILNAPKFVDVLHSTCSPFIPDDYRKRITICSDGGADVLRAEIDPDRLPVVYGGERKSPKTGCPLAGIRRPHRMSSPCARHLADIPDKLHALSIPAGGSITRVYNIMESCLADIFLRHSDGFTFVVEFQEDDGTWSEFATSAERAGGVRQTDRISLRLPRAGLYRLVFGNQAAWFFGVSVQMHLRTRRLPSDQWTDITTLFQS